MLSLDEKMAYWRMLLRHEMTGNPTVDRHACEEIRVALRDALSEVQALHRKTDAIAENTQSAQKLLKLG